MEETAIKALNLGRKFGNFWAVKDVILKINKGDIFGFIGPNGSGKSTTIRMLTGLLGPSEGEAKVLGFDVRENPEKIKKNIGYVSQSFSLYEDLTAFENMRFYAAVYRAGTIAQQRKRINEVIKWLDLKSYSNFLARHMPKGSKQLLALGCALIHNPRLIFLDEPTAGMDLLSRQNFWGLIRGLAETGVTVFVTTHYLDEVKFCTKLSFIHEGKLVYDGTPLDLAEKKPDLSLEDIFLSFII